MNEMSLTGLGHQLGEVVDRLVQVQIDPHKDSVPLQGIVREGRRLALRVAEIEINQIAYSTVQTLKVWATLDQSKLPEKLEFKRSEAKRINAICGKWGTALAHPESGEPCTLLVINDKADGRFVLENRVTKKRTNTATDIKGVMPFKVVDVATAD